MISKMLKRKKVLKIYLAINEKKSHHKTLKIQPRLPHNFNIYIMNIWHRRFGDLDSNRSDC